MFNRAAFLLLPALLLLVESLKINELVKRVGRRSRDEDRCLYHLECAWQQMTENQILNVKQNDSNRIARAFVYSTSAEDYAYQKSFDFLESILHPDMTAKVCGHEKDMNAIQYTKFLKSSSAHYKIFPYRNYAWDFEPTSERSHMNIKINVNQTDNLGAKVELYFDLTLKINVNSKNEFSLFQIHHIHQYGTCGEHGVVGYNTFRSIDEAEELKKTHVAKYFFDLITPSPYMDTANPGKIPMAWANGLKDFVTINVCRDGTTEPVTYTKAHFQAWYKRFAMLWHPAKDETEPMKLQTIDFNDNGIVARITFKLQIGRKDDEPVHEWDIKFSAKNMSYSTDRVEVLCSPSFNLKEISLRAMREVITESFVDNIVSLPKPNHWYSSVEFVKLFTKTGTVELHHCDIRKTEVVSQIDLFEYDRSQKYNVKFLKYWIDEKDLELSATDTVIIRFKTISAADTEKPEYEFEHPWEVTLKWDDMDQFYYIEKIEIGCSKHNFPGENEQDDMYNLFSGGLIGGGKK
ncbi:unnamed protein product [Caenorhabditis brenneri]